MKSNVPPGVTDIVRSFNPFGGTYPADPYRFFSEARAATSVFYHPETNFWVVTRYNDIRQIFQNTKLSNALDTPGVCPAAGKIYVDFFARRSGRLIPLFSDSFSSLFMISRRTIPCA